MQTNENPTPKVYVVIKTNYNERTIPEIIVDCVFTDKAQAEKYIAYAKWRGYSPRTIVENYAFPKFDWLQDHLQKEFDNIYEKRQTPPTPTETTKHST